MFQMDNKVWADKIISKLDPSFRYRWEVYDSLICTCLSKNTVWIDLGCGGNSSVEIYGDKAGYAVGVDIKLPKHVTTAPFICADLRHLPIRSSVANFVTLRFVVEHLSNIPLDLFEIERILKPGGSILILTTNTWSPFIFLSRLLPFSIKNIIFRTLYKIPAADVQPTFHKFNSVRKMKCGIGDNIKLSHIEFIQDANYTNRLIFLAFFFWHLFTKWFSLKFLRTCIIAVFHKQPFA